MNHEYNLKVCLIRPTMSDEFKFMGTSVPNFSIICGGLLVMSGIASYLISDTGSLTALIPSIFGAPLIILGLLSNKNISNKHHYMHASMVFALISVMGGLRIFSTWSDASDLTIFSHLFLIIIGVTFMISGILSFRHARKLRESLGE